MHEKAERAFTYNKLVKGLKQGKFKKIVIQTGAGISVSAGIPDYRSKNGYYDLVKQNKLPEPQKVFNTAWFLESP